MGMFLVAFILTIIIWLLLGPVWDYGKRTDAWWWHTFMKSDGWLLASPRQRIDQMRQRAVGMQYSPNSWRKSPQATSLASMCTYWEQDVVGWRLWNYERHNLALVVRAITDNGILWRVFPSSLHPSANGYQLVEHDYLVRRLLDAPYQLSCAGITGYAHTVEEGKRQAARLVADIQAGLPIVWPDGASMRWSVKL